MNQKLVAMIVAVTVISLGLGYVVGSSANSNTLAVSSSEIETRDQKIEMLEKQVVQLQERLDKSVPSRKSADDNLDAAIEGMRGIKNEGDGHKIKKMKL